jgi:hypothetical protein
MIGGGHKWDQSSSQSIGGHVQILSSNINPKVDFKIRINILRSKRTLGTTPKERIPLSSYDCVYSE